MVNNNQTAPVTDEELDQMIWKLERDGMTPKMLSLMRELREVRRAKVEPVAYAVSNDAWNQGNHKQHINGKLCDLIFPGDTFHGKELKPGNYDHAFPLYSAPSSQGPLSAPDKWPEKLNWSHHDDMTQAEVMAWNNAIEACRAATLNHSGNSEQLEPVSNRDELPPNSFTNEDLAGLAHGDNPQANAYRELLARRLNSPATSDGWIPVSERMPDKDGNYWGWWSESKRQGPVWFIKSELQAQFQSSEITHWMPLPAAPKEVG